MGIRACKTWHIMVPLFGWLQGYFIEHSDEVIDYCAVIDQGYKLSCFSWYFHFNTPEFVFQYIIFRVSTGGFTSATRGYSWRISFLMRWVFIHIALKGCSPPHTNEPVQFWIGFGLVLIGGSGLNLLGLLTPHWIIQLVIDRNAIENL